MVTLGLEENLQQVIVLLGAFCGNFFATMIPFWQTQQKYGEWDIKIIFDPRFLSTAAVAAIGSFTIVIGAFATILNQVPTNATIIITFASAAGIGFTLNTIGNWLMPSPNKTQKALLEEKQKSQIIQEYEDQKKLQSLDDSNSLKQQTTATTTTA